MIARTFCCAIALLALNGCDSGGDPAAPGDEVTSGNSAGVKSSRDASTSKKRDAGKADPDEAEAADDEGDTSADDGEDTSANAGTKADASVTTPGRREDAGAGHDAGVRADAGAGTGAMESCDTLTYQSFAKAFVEKYCTECHNSKTSTSKLGGVALDTLPGIMKADKALLKRVVIPRTDGIVPAMPKGGDDRLTDAERTKFGAWIDCGQK